MSITLDRLRTIADKYTEAWNTGHPEAVASFFAPEGAITINGGEEWRGREGVANMAAGFYRDVPNLRLACEGVRWSGNSAIYPWTFTGTHAGSGQPLAVSGWEEWSLDDADLIELSRGNFDAEDYARQAAS